MTAAGDPVRLLVNPAAGGGRAARAAPAVLAALSAAGRAVPRPVRRQDTRSLEHAEELAAAARDAGDVCAVLSGDGMLGRVAGVLAGTDGVLAPLPGGRGNDFVRMLGLPPKPVAAAQALCSPGAAVRSVDVGVVQGAAVPGAAGAGAARTDDAGGCCFLGIASVGFDSDVQALANATRLPLGQLVYVYAALRALAGWRPARFEVTVDGLPARVVVGWAVAAANSAYYGGGMRLAPRAALDDGRLQLVTSAATSRARFLRALPTVFRGTHVDEPTVSVSTVAGVSVSADRPFVVYADGEPLVVLPARVAVRPRALRVLAPAPATD